MNVLVHIQAGRNLFLNFSVFEASLMVEAQRTQLVSIAFSRREGDRCMKDTDHPISHPRVHLGDRANA
jgi:hypothetical protein